MVSTSSLSVQASVASEFIEQAWPLAKQRAGGLFDPERLGIERVIFCGCGDSHHAAISLAWTLTRLTGLPAVGLTAMEASRYLVPNLRTEPRHSLLVGISASGATARTREAVALARKVGMRTLALSSLGAGPLASEADRSVEIPLPSVPTAPGLLSYLASLIAGFALGYAFAGPEVQAVLDAGLQAIPMELRLWREQQTEMAGQFFNEVDPMLPIEFLGSGPAHGSARFAAAKVIEICGQVAWGQDVEEWAHLEYFCDPAQLPLWILSGHGAALGREREVAEAARRIGRTLAVSEWNPAGILHGWLRESLAPLVLWAGPVAFADLWMTQLGGEPFRGFGGGRSRTEGGGISRIRSSRQVESLDDLRLDRSRN
jgi:glucosamine--fructose-6-phosphate aminotransferase (isomerizing)